MKNKNTCLIGLLGIFIILFGISPAVLAAEYTFTSIDALGATLTISYGINDSGQIVGFFNDPNAPGTNGRGFLLSGGVFTTFDMPGITYPEGTIAYGINNLGQIVGMYGYGQEQKAFLLSDGTFSAITPPGAYLANAYGINDLGQIVGYVVYHTDYAWAYKGFLLSDGIYTFIEVPGAIYTLAYGINNSGQIVGEYVNSDQIRHGFLYSNGVFTTIDAPGAHLPDGTIARGINNVGQIVGEYVDSDIRSRGFILDNGIFTPIDVPGYNSANAYGINNVGQIVGMREMSHGFLANPIPDTMAVNIEIMPQVGNNVINWQKDRGTIQVGILSGPNFDAPNMVDNTTLTFGRSGDEVSFASCNKRPQDLSGDGKKNDLLCSFYNKYTNFQCGDIQGILKGRTKDGIPIEGHDAVIVVKCK